MTAKKQQHTLVLESEITSVDLMGYFLTLHPQKYTRKKDGKIVIKIEGDFVFDFKAEKYCLSIKEKVKQK